MGKPLYNDEVAWRYSMIMSQLSIRRSISEFSFIVAGIAIGFALSSWWPIAPYVASQAAFITAVGSYLRDTKAQKALDKFINDYSGLD